MTLSISSPVSFIAISVFFLVISSTTASGQTLVKSPDVASSPKKISIILDANSLLHTYQGLGAIPSYEKLLFDYPEKQRSEILDLLFKPGVGAALQILKVEIGYDGNNTAVSWPSYQRSLTEKPDFNRGYVWWMMKEAKKRNPTIKLSALHWGYPAWANTSELQARFIFGFVKGAKEVHGLTIDYIGGNTNENFEYGRAFINMPVAIILRKLLDDNGFSHVKIVAADEGSKVRKYNVMDSIAANQAYSAAIDVIGVHYKDRPSDFIPQLTYKLGKELWSSEDGGGGYKNPGSGYGWADQITRLLVDVKMNGIIRWSATASVYDNMPWASNGIIKAKEPWSGHYQVGANLWSFAHFTHFTEPGWKIMNLQDSDENRIDTVRKYIAFLNPESRDYSVVINTNASYVPKEGLDVELNLKNGLSGSAVQVWRSDFTSGDQWFKHVTDNRVVNGKISLHLDKGCLYTISTQKSNEYSASEIPSASEFPFPYSEDFEGGHPQNLPPYFTDANGNFEIGKSAGGKISNVLRQTVEEAPRMWHDRPLSQPLTELGDMQWTDYRLEADVLLENPGKVHIAGRFDGSAINSGNYHLEGYWLSLDNTGKWQLIRKDSPENLSSKADIGEFVVLAEGRVSGFGLNKWLKIGLEFSGETIHAYIGSKKVISVQDGIYKNGNVALATSGPGAANLMSVTLVWTNAQFDNLQVSGISND